MLADGTVRVAPVRTEDLPAVGGFLHRHLNARLSPGDWAAAAVPTWQVDGPNHGFRLLAGDELVGVQLAFYADRTLASGTVRTCNLGAWSVLEPYRAHSLRLLRAVLSQRGLVFTDLSPSGSVVAIDERLRFVHLDTATALVANVPGPRRSRVRTDLDEIEERLDAAGRVLLRDHRRARAAHHVLLETPSGECCYVVYRRDRRRRVRLFASLLHVSDPALLRRCRHDLGRHLLARGLPFTLVELRIGGGRPAGSVLLRHPRPKLVRADPPRDDLASLDGLYSELALVAW